jgi:hypothetical protein
VFLNVLLPLHLKGKSLTQKLNNFKLLIESKGVAKVYLLKNAIEDYKFLMNEKNRERKIENFVI